MSVTAAEDGHSLVEPLKNLAHNDEQSVADRLKFVEKEYTQLSALFHEYLAEPKDIESEAPIEVESPRLPACEITHLSAAEWRAMQDRSLPRTSYSLLTVGPKGRGDSIFKTQAIDAQPEVGKVLTEVSVESVKAPKSSHENAYRVILNGRAELMETLGEILNSLAAPGFYFMIWPFKHLIRNEERLKRRLLEEESQCPDKDERPGLEETQQLVDGVRPAFNGESPPNQQSEGSATPSLKAEALSETLVKSETEKARYPSENSKQQAVEVSNAQEKDPEIKSQTGSIANITQQSPVSNPKLDEVDAAERPVKTEQESSTEGEQETRKGDRTRLRDELRCIVQFMDEDMKDIFTVQKGLDDSTRKTIAFDYLWQLYKPGDVVISQKKEQKRAYVVLHVTGGRALNRSAQTTVSKEKTDESWRYLTKEQQEEKEAYLAKHAKTTPLVVDCFYIDFDGTNFGPLPQKFTLSEYEGEVAINSLEVYPTRFDNDPKQTEKILIKRGKRFVKLAQGGHKYYSGRTIREPLILETEGEVEGEIMIDFTLAIRKFRRMRYDWGVKFGTGVIANPTPADERELQGYYNVVPGAGAEFKPTYFMEDATYDKELRTDFTDKTSLLKERPYTEKLSSDTLMLLPPRVYGFSLLERKWFAFDLSKVEDIKESGQSFDHLVLPDDHKKIMQALVQHHTKGPAPSTTLAKRLDEEFSMDIIRGKGRGLIILLHGVPGVGKTSTAECVAAQTKRPLFPITCGDIGVYPEIVEDRLTEYFDMAHKWGCVLLLDEADVFLAKREKGGDLQRNGIVSVFLRVLEYYSGILILTTNRIGEFDEAFSSRVHIKLFYPKLDRKSTLAIWKMNMARIAESDMDIIVKEDEIKKFAKKMWAESADKQTQRWNGRQIRNAFQTAIALAKWDHQEAGNDSNRKPILSVRQFEVVAKTSAHFDDYISKMHGIDEYADTWDTIAARDFLRKNETPRKPTSRAAAAGARARGGRVSVQKVQSSDDDEDRDETDSDDNEEKMKKLQAELERRQKIKSPSAKKNHDGLSGQEGQKAAPAVEPDDDDASSSTDSDEN